MSITAESRAVAVTTDGNASREMRMPSSFSIWAALLLSAVVAALSVAFGLFSEMESAGRTAPGFGIVSFTVCPYPLYVIRNIKITVTLQAKRCNDGKIEINLPLLLMGVAKILI
jgi:hypothetical protein